MNHARILAAAAVLSLLSACGGADPVAENADTEALPAPAEANASDPSGAPPPAATPDSAAAPDRAERSIPAAFHGRWGLSPGDCTSTRGDAKGLLVVSGGELRFYESRAVPAKNAKASGESFSADFAFTGEGQSWTRYETLQLKGADELVRTESGPMASFTYVRCK